MISRQSIKKYGTNIIALYEFPLEWLGFIGIGLVDVIWRANTWLVMPFSGAFFFALLFPPIAKLLLWGLINADLLAWPRFLPALKRIFLAIEYLLVCAGAVYMMVVFSYLDCTLSYPLIDQQLNQADHAVGFDWLQWFNFIQGYFKNNPSNQWVYAVLQLVYGSLFYQFVFFAIWFAFCLQKNRLCEVFWVKYSTLLVTIIIAGFFPALGPASLDGVESAFKLIKPDFNAFLLHVEFIRSGRSPDFLAHDLVGLITFPSFHTASAIIYMYAFRKTGLLGFAVFFFNLVMLVAIPFFGNHYLSDMLAGATVTFASIILIRILSYKIHARFLPLQHTS